LSKKALGTCALTGNIGAFVKSHILPRSLTPKDQSGGRLIESDGFDYPRKQYDSWYDPNLVIRLGEDILERIDDAAYKELHKSKLIWKSWESQSELNLIETAGQGVLVGLRDIEGLDQQSLGRFVVSVLWRAGSSNISAMKDFSASALTLEHARQVTLGREDFDPAMFPIRIFQYVTKGPIHNLAPMNHEVVYPDGRQESFFRIFSNGVFFHVVDVENSPGFNLDAGRWYLGNNLVLAVLGLKFDGSSQGNLVSRIYSHYVSSTA
jgi:hypothetical protein